MSEELPRWRTLEAVEQAVRTCTLCQLAETRTRAVPGEGSSHPTILFIGEGPGFNEDQQGRPFVGRAGALLNELLSLIPMRREDVYITNVVKCRPPENRDPLPIEVQTCWPYLEAQIRLLEPRVIATLGRHSLIKFFPEAKISQQHGQPMPWRDKIVFPLYHPAAGLRSTGIREALEKDFRKLPTAVIAAIERSARLRGEVQDRHQSGEPGAEPDQQTGSDEDRQQLSFF